MWLFTLQKCPVAKNSCKMYFYFHHIRASLTQRPRWQVSCFSPELRTKFINSLTLVIIWLCLFLIKKKNASSRFGWKSMVKYISSPFNHWLICGIAKDFITIIFYVQSLLIFYLQEILLAPRLHSCKSIFHDNMLNQLLVTLGWWQCLCKAKSIIRCQRAPVKWKLGRTYLLVYSYILNRHCVNSASQQFYCL